MSGAGNIEKNKKARLAVLVSGRGSNMQALMKGCKDGIIDAEIAIVVTDRPDALAIERARSHSIPTKIIERKDYESRALFDEALADCAQQAGAEIVCLAGFMRILSGVFLDRFRGMVVNIHPSLLPSFPGLDAQRQALEHGVKVSGCTVHFVDEGVDTGPIIAQTAVPVMPDDTVDSLSDRILEQEHLLYPRALQSVICGDVKNRVTSPTH